MNRLSYLLALFALLGLAGCSGMVTHGLPAETIAALEPESRACAHLLAATDSATARSHVADAMHSRVPEYPYLRVNRLLASYRKDALDRDQFAEWTARMADLARDGYAVEIANLPSVERAVLDGMAGNGSLPGAVSGCIGRLLESDLAHEARRRSVADAASVPDDYADWKRAVGLYYLTRIPFAAGVRRNHQEMESLFQSPLETPDSQRLTYRPDQARLNRDQVRVLMQRSRSAALKIPDPAGADLDALFATFAPVFEVDSDLPDDRIGALAWSRAVPVVEPLQPVIYTHKSHVRVQGRALLQLNYIAWFPSRPKRGAWDALGGHLDGLTWRVTLDEEGKPLLFDSIHNCGCYHLFVATDRLRPRPDPSGWEESALITQTLDGVATGNRETLRIRSDSHYLYRVVMNDDGKSGGRIYALRPYTELRTLAQGNGASRSVFDEQGLIQGTERLERYFFWPMGIAEPGAMRILGRHATAFIGRRHFDDSNVLERYFEIAEP